MPSKKPQILIRTEQDLIDKLDNIAYSQNRSRANLAEKILSDYVKNYESSHTLHSSANYMMKNEDLSDETLRELIIKTLKNELIEDNQKHA